MGTFCYIFFLMTPSLKGESRVQLVTQSKISEVLSEGTTIKQASQGWSQFIPGPLEYKVCQIQVPCKTQTLMPKVIIHGSQ